MTVLTSKAVSSAAAPSRIAAARHQAAVAKQALAVGAVTLFGLLVLFLRAGHSTASTPTAGQSAATAGDEAYDDGLLGGGAISRPSPSYGYPSAETRTS